MSGRPQVHLCLATSLDGRIAEGPGRPPSFTSRFDRDKLFRLRAESDLLLVGAGTVRGEQLPPLIRDEALVAARRAAGKPDHPAVAIVSGSLNLPWDAPYFTERAQEIHIISGPTGKRARAAIDRLGLGHIDAGKPVSLAHAITALGRMGYRNVLAEGGGRMVHALFAEDLVDVFHLTLAPTLISGTDTPLLCPGERLTPRPSLALDTLHREDDELHLTYRRPGSGG